MAEPQTILVSSACYKDQTYFAEHVSFVSEDRKSFVVMYEHLDPQSDSIYRFYYSIRQLSLNGVGVIMDDDIDTGLRLVRNKTT